ncbi:hypothetical protein IDJ77_19785 [Mucilaginibacter sp. ZT4R22]|uniref:Uncharacterized protein n=1 Tax=Mucilaginibacter pankratovii TaxID=2772110 RepID=A0ABR7WXR7_9SPHI|nr:hypothetical protein [Mucilaginibacter pankratovii]MBD1366062.1 hypothetical protein [Mucilaginibacter pankratovii]
MTEFEESLQIEKPARDVISVDEKIYTVKQIQVATFLGGPLVAGYLIANNFRAFNEYDKAKKAWLIAIAATVAVFALIFVIPESVKIPNIAFPLIYSWATYILVTKYQAQQMKEHIRAGGQSYNWGRAIVVALIGVAVTVVLLVIGVFGFQLFFPSENY